MKRRTKIIWGSVVGVIGLGVTAFWFNSDLVRQSGDTLETVLANADSASGAPPAPSMERDWIVKTVRDATGRTIEFEGAFDAWLLPLPGLLVGRASLSNAEGFGDTPFATIEGMEVRVGSMSPFDKRIVIERSALAGLRLNLERNAAGEVNWDTGPSPQPAAGAAAPAAPPAPTAAADGNDGWSTSVEAVEITDAVVNWQDAMTGGSWKLSAFNLRASEIQPDADFPIAVSFAFERDATAVAIESAMRASAMGDRLRLDALSFSFSDVDPGDLRSLFSTAVVTGSPEVVARAGASRSLEFTGAGNFDDTTRVLEFSGNVRLADGGIVPVTIGGTIEVPGIVLGQ
jgi:hypothetical protein